MKNTKYARPVRGGKADAAVEAANAKFKAGAEVRARILEAASKLFAEAGYPNVSMRRIAQEAGCSTMAAYYHFKDKSALFEQLCIDLYEQFTVHPDPDPATDPKERLIKTIREFVRLSAKYPHHYRLAFLTPPIDEHAQELRVKITRPMITHIRDSVRMALSPNGTDAIVEERLYQLLAVTHGMTVMLITHPRVYELTAEKAIRELDSAFESLMNS